MISHQHATVVQQTFIQTILLLHRFSVDRTDCFSFFMLSAHDNLTLSFIQSDGQPPFF